MRALLLITLLFSITMTGCAVMDKVIPPKYDDSGEPIPGSREPIPIAKDVADTIPYGNVALNLLLLAVAGIERYRAAKLTKGLKATLAAGKAVAKDPELAKLWEKVKESYYRPVHESAGVTQLIKTIIAKL